MPLPFLYGLQWIVDAGLKKSNHPLLTEWNDIYAGRINADLLVMGSSRAVNNYSTKILDEELKINSYDLGMNGYRFPMHYERFKIYLKHNRPPRLVVQNLDSFLLSTYNELYDSGQFLPFLDDPDIRRATAGYKGEFKALDYYFPLYKYNFNQDLMVTGFLNFFDLAKIPPQKYKGYKAEESSWNGSFEKIKQMYPNGMRHTIEPDTESKFIEYLQFCYNNNIKVIMVYSPEYIAAQDITLNHNEIVEHFRQLAEQNNAEFLDYSKNSISYDKHYFLDSQHLNKTGAEMFTYKLANEIKNIK